MQVPLHRDKKIRVFTADGEQVALRGQGHGMEHKRNTSGALRESVLGMLILAGACATPDSVRQALTISNPVFRSDGATGGLLRGGQLGEALI
ncbi:MAG: hypothetical protein ACKODH_04485 [Limisphaerales bacterium]